MERTKDMWTFIRDLIRDIFPKYTVDDTMYRELPLRQAEALWLNGEAIRSHKYYINKTDDNELTLGTDVEHQNSIDFYESANFIIKGYTVKGLSKEQAVERYRKDAQNHWWLICNPGYVELHPEVGSQTYNLRWFYRWLGVAKYIEDMVK